MQLVLASASPRRAELLSSAGFRFSVAPADVDETRLPGEAPRDYALRVARDKARTIAARPPQTGATILAADTVVVAGREILGKPVDRSDARRMLRLLSGTVHEVLTAVVLSHGGRETAEVVRTRVRFVPLRDDEIEWYLETGDAIGKAGGYGIQGPAARFIDWIDGTWSNVVGLPIATVYRLLREAGVLC